MDEPGGPDRLRPGSGAGGDECHFTDEVVASIASLAAAEVEGVTAVGGGLALDLGDMLAKRPSARGVRVEVGSREAAVDVYLQVAYGVRIPLVAQRVQENVKRAVESMTGLRVVEVNVHVQGVDLGRVQESAERRRAEALPEPPRVAGGVPGGAQAATRGQEPEPRRPLLPPLRTRRERGGGSPAQTVPWAGQAQAPPGPAPGRDRGGPVGPGGPV